MVLEEILVRDIMADDFLIAYEDTPLFKIKEMLIKKIIKKETLIYDNIGNIQGIITMKDISNLIKRNSKDIYNKFAKDIAVKEVISISEESNLLRCRDIMLENNIGRLIVIKEGKVVGVVRQEHIRDFYYMKIEEISKIIKSAIDYIHEAVCIIDNKGTVIVWNTNAEKLYNLPKEKKF